MKQIIVKIINNYKPAFVILLVAVIGMQTLGVIAQTAPAKKTELESSTAAKRALAGINSRNLAKIKDARMRSAIQQSYKSLKAIADNGSKPREAGLMAEFDRSIKNLKSLPQPTAGGLQECDDSYTRCMELCGETGADCKLCGLGQNGCYLTKLSIEMTKDPLAP